MDSSCVCDSNGHRLKSMLLPSETERWIDVSVTIGIRHLIWSAPPFSLSATPHARRRFCSVV